MSSISKVTGILGFTQKILYVQQENSARQPYGFLSIAKEKDYRKVNLFLADRNLLY